MASFLLRLSFFRTTTCRPLACSEATAIIDRHLVEQILGWYVKGTGRG